MNKLIFLFLFIFLACHQKIESLATTTPAVFLHQLQSTGSDVLYYNAVQEDKDGNLFVMADFTGTLTSTLAGLPTIASNGGYNCLLLKLSPKGALLNYYQITGSTAQHIYCTDMYINENQEIFLTGQYSGDIQLSRYTYVADSADGYLLKLDKNLKPLWWRLFTGTNNQEFFNLSQIGANIIIGGGTQESTNNLFSSSDILGQTDSVLVKYNQNGDLLEKNMWGGANNEIIRGALAADKYNNTFIGAHTLSPTYKAKNTIIEFTKANYNVVILKYNNHSQIEKKLIIEGSQADQLRQLGVYNDHLYAFIYSNSADLKIGPNTYSSPSATYYNAYLVKTDLNLNVLNVKQFYATLGSNCAHACFSIDDKGNIFVNFFFSGTLTYDAQTITASGVNNAMTIMFDENFNIIKQIQVPSSINSGFYTKINRTGQYWIGAGVFNTTLNFLGRTLTSSGANDFFIFKTPL